MSHNPRLKKILFRVSDQERKQLDMASQNAYLTLSNYIRKKIFVTDPPRILTVQEIQAVRRIGLQLSQILALLSQNKQIQYLEIEKTIIDIKLIVRRLNEITKNYDR